MNKKEIMQMKKQKEVANHHMIVNYTTTNHISKKFVPYEPDKLCILKKTSYCGSLAQSCKSDILHIAKFTRNGKEIDGAEVWRKNQELLKKERQISDWEREALTHEDFWIDNYNLN